MTDKCDDERDRDDDCDAAGLSGELLGLHEDELEKLRIACLAIWGLFTAEERRTINEQKFHQRCESWVLHAIGRLATELDGSKDDSVVEPDDLKVVGNALDNSVAGSSQFMIRGNGDSVIEWKTDLCICLEDVGPRSVSWHVLAVDGGEITTLQIDIGDSSDPLLRQITQTPQELADFINGRLKEGWQLLGGNFGIDELKGLIAETDEVGRLVQ